MHSWWRSASTAIVASTTSVALFFGPAAGGLVSAVVQFGLFIYFFDLDWVGAIVCIVASSLVRYVVVFAVIAAASAMLRSADAGAMLPTVWPSALAMYGG